MTYFETSTPNGTEIRILSEYNEGMDYTFVVGNDRAKEAKNVLFETWDLWWDELRTYWEDLSMFDALEIALNNEGIPFSSVINEKQTCLSADKRETRFLQRIIQQARSHFQSKVYLYPAKDCTYRAVVARVPWWPSFSLLTKEGSYPAELLLARTDMNGEVIYVPVFAKDRKDLLEHLRFAGKCRQYIVSLWDYHEDKATRKSLLEILGKAWNRRWELEHEAAMEFYEEAMEFEKEIAERGWETENSASPERNSSGAFFEVADDDDDLPF